MHNPSMSCTEMDKAISAGKRQCEKMFGDFQESLASVIAELEADPEKAREAEQRSNEYMRRIESMSARRKFQSIVQPKFRDIPDELPLDCPGMSENGRTLYKAFARKIQGCWEQIRDGNRLNLLLLGDPGVGKSYAASWIILKAVSERRLNGMTWNCVYQTGDQLAQRYKGAEGFAAKYTKQDVWESVLNPSHLSKTDIVFIDEVGRYKSAQEIQAIFDIVDNADCSIILASNIYPQIEFRKYLGDGIMDRLVPHSFCIDTSGMESFRKSEVAKNVAGRV